MYFLMILVGEIYTDLVTGRAVMERPRYGAVSRNMEESPLTHPKGSGKASWKAPC